VTIHGTRQFGEAKAKQHAMEIAGKYLHEEKHEDLPALPELEWTPTGPSDWLTWRA
jgi:hypothetical protein